MSKTSLTQIASGFFHVQREEEMDYQEIENRFGYHKASEEVIPYHTAVRKTFIEMTAKLIQVVPSGREQALMMTALEQASMWANAGVARNMSPLVRE